MGDYLSPKRRDVVDRLRKRIDLYRKRQNSVHQRYEYGHKSVYEQDQRQHALLLRQKWLESKAKKSSKSKTKAESNHPDHRNPAVAKQLKRKLDGNALENQAQNNAENVYHFDDDDTAPAKNVATSTSANIEGLSSSVSVHIVHQINSSTSTQEQKISTNVTVNQTLGSQNESETDVQSNVECKKEPHEEAAGRSSAPTASNDKSAELDSQLVDILNTIENIPPQDIKDELNTFDEIYETLIKGGNENRINSSSESSSMFASNMYMDPSQGSGPVRTPPVQSFRAGPQHVPSSISEGGPAAEVLKQMAAHHQQHHPGQEQFGVKSAIDPFSDLSDSSQYSTRNGYTSGDYQYTGMPRSGSTGPYTGQPNMGYQSKQAMPPYAASTNKQLTHFSQNVPSSQSDTGPSSLQQLQNQVAHFNQGPQMEITQTQHMQLSNGSHQMQMSQTQHVQLRQPIQNISLTQQQGFTAPNMGSSTSGQSPNFMGSEQMGMSQQQQQQQQMMQNKMTAAAAAADPHQSHLHQQYMNRPPPEYKMQQQHTSGMPVVSGMGPNPLQPMQNMVNQTNTHQNQAYSSMKGESSDMQMQNGMRPVQMSAMQQQMSGVSLTTPVMSLPQAAQMNYSNQSVQRQASFPGAMGHPLGAGRNPRQSAPTYTSAIMRNQRPPNVNIGPDGLNISQPRQQEWPRGMMPQGSGPGPRPGGVPVTSGSIMQYRSYSSDGHSGNATGAAAQMQQMQQQQHAQGHRGVHMDTMQSQQAAMLQSNPHAQQMIMQQQRMHVSHPMAQRPHTSQSSSYSMTSQPGSTYPPHSSGSQDDILNLLDTAPNQSTDFFDVQTSGGGADPNWDDIADILGNPK